MAESIVSVLSSNRASRVDQNLFKNANNFGKLDVVINANENAGNTSSKQNSIQKIASFKPIQLKSFSSRIETNTAQRKQASQVREAKQAIVKEKVQSTREQNPFTKNNPVEAQTGGKVNIST